MGDNSLSPENLTSSTEYSKKFPEKLFIHELNNPTPENNCPLNQSDKKLLQRKSSVKMYLKYLI